MAEAMTVGWIAQAVGARWDGAGDGPVAAVQTDSRKVGPGDLFVALRGERFDGHDFVPAAWEAGAAAVLVARPVVAPTGRAVLQVDDTLLAYGALASAWRQEFGPLVVAITGSLGKSTTKELTGAVLSRRFRTLVSPGSFNNEVGLPATLLQLTADHEAVVLEMAMRGLGQIAYLAEIARPSIGVITNIGVTHVEMVGSPEAVATAKGELLDSLGPDGTAVLNADDPRLPRIAPRHRGRTLWYGFGAAADVRAEDVRLRGLTGSEFRLVTPVGEAGVQLTLSGRHMVSNALAAATVGYLAGLAPEAIATGLASVSALPMRGQVMRLVNGARVINDAYNAAPDSVRAALAVLAAEPAQRRIAVLGDMLELGELSESEHRALGPDAAAAADVVVAVGERAKAIAVGARDAGATEVHWVADAMAAGELLAGLLREGDLALVKASRMVGLERALELLEVAP